MVSVIEIVAQLLLSCLISDIRPTDQIVNSPVTKHQNQGVFAHSLIARSGNSH